MIQYTLGGERARKIQTYFYSMLFHRKGAIHLFSFRDKGILYVQFLSGHSDLFMGSG